MRIKQKIIRKTK